MDRENLHTQIYTQWKFIHPLKKVENLAIPNNMDKSGGHYAK